MSHITATSRYILPDLSLDRFLQPQRLWAKSKMYAKLDVDRRQIRLASVLPGRWSENVCCKLTVVSLDDKPSYEALSYVWGALSDKVPIYLEGVEFPVTKSLHLALRRLRHVDKIRYMWVDALCINQSDSELPLCPIIIIASSCLRARAM